MFGKVWTACVLGIDGHMIEVEVDLANGLPQVNVVGLPDTAVLLYDVLPDQAADAGTTGRGSDTVAVGCWTPAPTALDGVHVASHDPGQRGTSRVAGLRR